MTAVAKRPNWSTRCLSRSPSCVALQIVLQGERVPDQVRS
jgi:hypothetical protein